MTDAVILAMLKVDLGITTEVYDQRLAQYIESAKAQITREGITLDTDQVDDCMLIIMYSAWLWRKRADGDGMPRMLRYALNNRLFSEKMRETTQVSTEG